MRAVHAVVLLFVVLEALVSARAAAQTNEAERTALARSLFREGVELTEKQQFADAADRFRRAYELKPTPGVAFNLAQALVRSGELVQGSERLRDVVGNAEAPPDIAEAAKSLLEETEARIAHLTIRIEGADGGAKVRLDGERLESAAVGVAIPRDPGSHTVEVRRGGETVAQDEVTLDEGESAELVLDAGAAANAQREGTSESDRRAKHVPSAEGEAATREDDGGILTSWWLWTGAAVVAAGAVATGLVLGGVFDEPAPIEGNTMPGVLEWR